MTLRKYAEQMGFELVWRQYSNNVDRLVTCRLNHCYIVANDGRHVSVNGQGKTMYRAERQLTRRLSGQRITFDARLEPKEYLVPVLEDPCA